MKAETVREVMTVPAVTIEVHPRTVADAVRAEVSDGIVTLRGTLERRSQAVLLKAFAWDDEANSAAGTVKR